MITRTQQILIGLIIVQILLAGLVYWPREGANQESGPLFPELDPEQVTEIEILDEAGAGVTLRRSGSEWVLASSGDYPVPATRVGPVLANIAAINTSRLVARNQSSHERLQVAADQFLRRVHLTMEDGNSVILYLGSAPTAGATHVRRADRPETYLAPGLNVWDFGQQAGSWIDTSYVSLDREAITAVSLQNRNGRFSFTRTEGDRWTLDGLAADETFNQGNFNLIFNSTTNLRMSQPLGKTPAPAYGLDNPAARLTFTLADDSGTRTETLLVGATIPEKNRSVIKWSGSDYYVEVAASALTTVLEFNRQDFLTQPETEPES